VLVVRGEPGIGKTALLGYAARAAADFPVARAEGVESEMELPFAALMTVICPPARYPTDAQAPTRNTVPKVLTPQSAARASGWCPRRSRSPGEHQGAR